MPPNQSVPQDKDDHRLRNSLLWVTGFTAAGVATGGVAFAAGAIIEGAVAIGAGAWTLFGLAKAAYDHYQEEKAQSEIKLKDMTEKNQKLQHKLDETISEKAKLSTHLKVLESQQTSYQDEVAILKEVKKSLETTLENKTISTQSQEIQKYTQIEEAMSREFDSPVHPTVLMRK